MKKIDKIIFGLIFGAVIPIFTFLLFWWTSIPFVKNGKVVLIISLAGLLTGLVIDFLIKRFRNIDFFKISPKLLIGIYIFYSIGLFGFFMGVPVFHPLLGIIAGYYWGRRLISQQADNESFPSEIKKISMFTSIIICFICISSATISLIDKYTADNLRGMFNLPFDITFPMLLGFVITGGILLIVIQYWLTKVTIVKTLNLNR